MTPAYRKGSNVNTTNEANYRRDRQQTERRHRAVEAAVIANQAHVVAGYDLEHHKMTKGRQELINRAKREGWNRQEIRENVSDPRFRLRNQIRAAIEGNRLAEAKNAIDPNVGVRKQLGEAVVRVAQNYPEGDQKRMHAVARDLHTNNVTPQERQVYAYGVQTGRPEHALLAIARSRGL